MLPPDAPDHRSHARAWRTVGCLALVLLVGAGVFEAVVYFALPPYTWKGWVDRERKVPPKWEPRNPVPNAREDYAAAGALEGLTESDWAAVGDCTRCAWGGAGAPTAEHLTRVRELVAEHHAVLEGLHAGAGKQFELGIPPSRDETFPMLPRYRNAVHLAIAAAYVECLDGRGDAALQRLGDCLALGANLDSGEANAVLVAGGACVSMEHRAFGPLFDRADVSDEALREHLALDTRLRLRLDGLARNLTYESSLVNLEIDAFLAGESDALPIHEVGPLRAFASRTKAEASRAWALDRWARYIEIARGPDAVMRLRAAARREDDQAGERRDELASWVAGLFLAPLERHVWMEQTLLAQTTMCALELSRRERDSYPADLAELVPEWLAEIPVDLVDGAPLRYRREGDRYTLYSIGWDGVDDGGSWMSRPPLTQGGAKQQLWEPDIVFAGGREVKP